MSGEKVLMEIGKISLVLESWSYGDTLKLSHIEYQQDPYYGNEEIETDIGVEDAKQLIGHLQAFIDNSEQA